MKIGTCNYAEGHESHELNMEKCIRDANPNHLGHSILRTFIDSFEEKSPNGTHICLAYEPLREPLTLLQGRFNNETFPLDIFKAYMKFLLLGRLLALRMQDHPYRLVPLTIPTIYPAASS